MRKNHETKLHASLSEAIEKWMNDNCESEQWEKLDAYVGDAASDLMADAAFAVLMSQVDMNRFFEKEGMLKK